MTANELRDAMLAGTKLRSVKYADMVPVLKAMGYVYEGAEGKMRYWKHPEDRRVLPLRDEGDRRMHPGYIDDAAAHMRRVHGTQTGGAQ